MTIMMTMLMIYYDDDISSLPLARVVIPHGEGLVYISVCGPLKCLSTHEKNEGA